MKNNDLLYFWLYYWKKDNGLGGQMIPNSSLTSMYVRIVGENSLLSMAQSNALANLERVNRVRTHTFLANNGQDKNGVSQNYGEERYYSWNDTVIDCRNNPNLVDSDFLSDLDENMMDNKRFLRIKADLEERMGGCVEVLPYHSVLRGEDNTRFNIRSRSVDNFDVIRVGFKLIAKDDEQFAQGLSHLKELNNPFKIKKPAPNLAADPCNALA